MDGGVERARQVGVEAVASLRRSLARSAVDLIRCDPAATATAAELGLVDRQWLDDPGGRLPAGAPPVEVLERFLQRAVESRPSRLGVLGLGAVQALAALGAPPPGPGAGTVTEVAAGGEALVTARLAAAAGPVRGVRYGPGRPLSLKGVADVVEACEVLPAG